MMLLGNRQVEISLHMWEDAEHYGTTDEEIRHMVAHLFRGSLTPMTGAASVSAKTVGLYAWEVSE